MSEWKGKTMLDQNLVYQLQQRRNRAHEQLCCRRCSRVFGTWRHNLVAEALTKALTIECWRSILSLLRLPVRISWSLGKVDHSVSRHHKCLMECLRSGTRLTRSWQYLKIFPSLSSTFTWIWIIASRAGAAVFDGIYVYGVIEIQNDLIHKAG